MTATLSAPDKFRAFQQAMKAVLVERNEEIEIFTLALLAKQHAFFLGEPGIAKSMLIETGVQLIDGLDPELDYFNILFMKGTVREDVFGPLALSLLKEDRYCYQGDGYLPTAKIFFGDEFWKANAAIQNALLWATNERKYRNDGKVVELPLWSAFIASNEMPANDELLAIYDRFPLRRVTKPIAEPGAFMAMLRNVGNTKLAKPPITWDDIVAAHEESKGIKIGDDVIEAIGEVKAKLQEESIYPSDRRWVQSLSIIRAAAWLDGEPEADVYHLTPLRNMLWADPKDYPVVDKMLSGMANPLDLEVMKIVDDLGKLSRETDKLIGSPDMDDLQRQQQGSAIFDKLDSAIEELKDISTRAGNSKRRTSRLDDASDLTRNLTVRLLTKVFHTEEDAIKDNVDDFTSLDGTPKADADEDE